MEFLLLFHCLEAEQTQEWVCRGAAAQRRWSPLSLLCCTLGYTPRTCTARKLTSPVFYTQVKVVKTAGWLQMSPPFLLKFWADRRLPRDQEKGNFFISFTQAEFPKSEPKSHFGKTLASLLWFLFQSQNKAEPFARQAASSCQEGSNKETKLRPGHKCCPCAGVATPGQKPESSGLKLSGSLDTHLGLCAVHIPSFPPKDHENPLPGLTLPSFFFPPIPACCQCL